MGKRGGKKKKLRRAKLFILFINHWRSNWNIEMFVIESEERFDLIECVFVEHLHRYVRVRVPELYIRSTTICPITRSMTFEHANRKQLDHLFRFLSCTLTRTGQNER